MKQCLMLKKMNHISEIIPEKSVQDAAQTQESIELLVSPSVWEQSHWSQWQCSCTWCPAHALMHLCLRLQWSSCMREASLPLLSRYVLCACTRWKSSCSDHPEFPKCLLNCHLFAAGEMFSWWPKAYQSRYLTSLVDFNSYRRFILHDLIQSTSKQIFTERDSKVWLHCL